MRIVVKPASVLVEFVFHHPGNSKALSLVNYDTTPVRDLAGASWRVEYTGHHAQDFYVAVRCNDAESITPEYLALIGDKLHSAVEACLLGRKALPVAGPAPVRPVRAAKPAAKLAAVRASRLEPVGGGIDL